MSAKKISSKVTPPTSAPAKKAVSNKAAVEPELTDTSGIAGLLPNPKNPRKPWKTEKQRKDFLQSLQTFGDLSGIVFNRTTKQLVGGHKRVEEFKKQHSELKITETLTKPDASGTVAYGQIVLEDGTRFAYRQVQWNALKESAANLAANKWGADWDLVPVGEMLYSLGGSEFDLAMLGFNEGEMGSFEVEGTKMPSLSNEEKSPFQQMAFTLQDDQVLDVKEAVSIAKKLGHGKSSLSDNSNGNALAYICQLFILENSDQSDPSDS